MYVSSFTFKLSESICCTRFKFDSGAVGLYLVRVTYYVVGLSQILALSLGEINALTIRCSGMEK